MDIGSKSSYVYVSTKSGRKVTGGEVATTREALQERLRPYVRWGLKVAIEAGNQTYWIYKLLVEMGAKVTVVNPTQVKLIAQSRRKTDKIDAKILCELLRIDALPHPVYMPGESARALRGLLVARRQLVAARTKLCNTVRGMVRQEGIQLPARALSSRLGWKQLLGRGFEAGHVLTIVASYYPAFKSLTEAIGRLDGELIQYERKDPRAARLQTMPKVGRIASLTFLAAVDEVQRFGSSRKLIGYSGLAPSVRASSERIEYGPITRAGRRELRGVWVQIAHLVAVDKDPDSRPLRTWFNRVARRRGKKTAVVALARRLLVIAYQLLKKEMDYDPARVKRVA
jgi:transposase